jgi:hypothetical protein
MEKKKPWKTRVERDVLLHDDISKSGVHGGKIIAEKLYLLSLIGGVTFLLIGIWALLNMLLGWGFPVNSATVILVLVVISIGSLTTLGGYFLYKCD